MASSVAAPTVVAGHPKAKWARVASLGFALVAAGMALWLIGGLLAGQSMGEEGAFFVLAIVVGLVAAVVVRRFGTVGHAIGITLGLGLAVMFFWVAFSLAIPGSFVEFSGAVMFVMGLATGVGYSIGAIVRRHELHVDPTRGETRAMRVMLGIVVLAMVVSGVLNLTTRSSVAAPAGAIAVEQANFEFSQATYTVQAGEDSTLVIHNRDAFTHDLVIPALGIESGLITPGSEKLVTILAPPAGDVAIYCSLHSSDTGAKVPAEDDMAAMLSVK
ncbi:MAG: cupredoxin domain-containing protein [Aldersonia sp.]|nr:cupredoxin domain-containing protein [Aldersonia sp.]